MSTKQKIGLIASTLIMVIAIIVIGPMDCFSHGYFCDEIDCNQVSATNDYKESVDLKDGYYEMSFSPQKKHMVGFEIYITNQPEKNTGRLCMEILDSNMKSVDKIEINLEKVKDATWYKVYANEKLKKGKKYLLRFSAENCETIPHLQNIDIAYLPNETLSGNIMLGYAYAEPTFTFQNKVIITLFILAIWLFICSQIMKEKYFFQRIKTLSVIVFLTSILTWNYMYSSMDNQNGTFSNFQADSEGKVTGVLYAEQDGTCFKEENEIGYGLGSYHDLKGYLNKYGLSYYSDNKWDEGYSREYCSIIVNSNIYSKEVATIGNYIGFENGEVFRIKYIDDNDSNIVIYLDSDKILTPGKYGNLDDATFYDSQMQPLDKSKIVAYKSQYGLQGKVFRHLARYMDDDEEVINLNLICCIATAVVLVLIVMLLAVKYNGIMARIFFLTFWLSPWIVNFARNLYWVEFTWFIPMLIGLFCAWKIDSRKCRIISYIAAFISILGKCLCGYEYISVIMMGMIAFLLSDLAVSVVSKDKKQIKLLFRTIFILGIVALAGFFTAICIHAKLKGEGNIIEGIRLIFEQDVLKRTVGGDLNEFPIGIWDSLNSSVWETYCKYFHFETEIITGISGNLFPILCIVPLCIFAYEYKKKKLNVELLSMYVIAFLTSISWFCLAKGHSYIHTHMNYVLWYFGFVQICIYISVNKILEIFTKKNTTLKQ